MKVDHTDALEKRIQAVAIHFLDSCSFYKPKDGSLLAVKMCAYCKFSDFSKDKKHGFCHFRIEKDKERNI